MPDATVRKCPGRERDSIGVEVTWPGPSEILTFMGLRWIYDPPLREGAPQIPKTNPSVAISA